MAENETNIFCRACLQEDEVMVLLHEEVHEFQTTLRTLLEQCGGIKVEASLECPEYICQVCTNELLIAAKFRKKCENTQQYLSELAEKTSDEINEIANEYEEIIEEEFINDNVIYDTIVYESEESNHDITCSEFETNLNESKDGLPESAHIDNSMQLLSEGTNLIVASEDDANLVDIDEASAATITVFSCHKCQQSFTHEEHLTLHACAKRTNVATNQRARKRICPHCGKSWYSQFALDTHMRTHTGERPFCCNQCGNSYKTKSALDSHMKLHSGTPDLKCSYCDKMFYDGSNLRRHLLTHTGDKPYACIICKKNFARHFLLQLHMRIHTGEKPFECRHCDRRFSQLSLQRSHERTHTGEMLYYCTECGKGFGRRKQLHIHEEKHKPGLRKLLVSNRENVEEAQIINAADMHSMNMLTESKCNDYIGNEKT